jgi:spore coat protein U-like protein
MNRALPCLAVLTLLSLAAPADAASCQASASDLVFGSYRFNSDVDVDSSATISISCVDDGSGLDVNYSIEVSAGLSGDFADRGMNGPGGPLHYNVYADASRSMVWGDGSGGSVTVSGGFTLPGTTSASHTAYGRVPSQQADIAAGHYADNLTITVTY